MSLQKHTKSKKTEPSEDHAHYASWGALAGGAIGLILTLIAGHWLSNTATLGVLGYIIGALIDRRRK